MTGLYGVRRVVELERLFLYRAATTRARWLTLCSTLERPAQQ